MLSAYSPSPGTFPGTIRAINATAVLATKYLSPQLPSAFCLCLMKTSPFSIARSVAGDISAMVTRSAGTSPQSGETMSASKINELISHASASRNEVVRDTAVTHLSSPLRSKHLKIILHHLPIFRRKLSAELLLHLFPFLAGQVAQTLTAAGGRALADVI